MGLGPDGDDGAFLAEVLRLLPEHLAEQLRVVGLEVVHDRPWPRLRTDFEEVPRPRRPRLAGAAFTPFGSEWRALSDYDDPATYVGEVASQVHKTWHRLPRDPDREEPQAPDPTPAEVAERWPWLLERLALTGPVTEVGRGRLEVQHRDGRILTVVVTPEQWARCGEPLDPDADDPQDLYSVDHDQVFLVCHEGELEWSIREELPPVRGGQQWRRDMARARARGDDMSRYRWHAWSPGDDDGPSAPAVDLT